MALSYALAFVRTAVKRWQGYVWAGRLSREILDSRVLTLSNEAEGHFCGGVIASRGGTLRGQRTWARTEVSMRENREVPRSPAVSIDASSWMVRGVVVRHRRVARGTLRR